MNIQYSLLQGKVGGLVDVGLLVLTTAPHTAHRKRALWRRTTFSRPVCASRPTPRACLPLLPRDVIDSSVPELTSHIWTLAHHRTPHSSQRAGAVATDDFLKACVCISAYAQGLFALTAPGCHRQFRP
ncbi:hypothetical protein J6590_037353 [Homalodisca vitripennis]|nr:hypothetical protein J6590_037353 [Homalodisca vitripennis]